MQPIVFATARTLKPTAPVSFGAPVALDVVSPTGHGDGCVLAGACPATPSGC